MIRFSSIGDIVLTTPVIRCLKQQTGAEIHYLTKPAFGSLLEANPHIDRIHLLQDDFGAMIRTLRKEQFDFVVDLHRNLRTLRVKWGLGVRSASFPKLNLAKWLLVHFKVNLLPDRHIVDRYMKAASPLGVVPDQKGLDYYIPEGKEADPADYLPAADHRFAVFAIGGAHATKRMPSAKISAICRDIPGPVLLLGGPGDQAAGEQIARDAGDHVINLCGKTSLHQSASLVQQSQLVITHDTGLMHIAAAFGKRTISIWGNTVPEFGMYPYDPQGRGFNTSLEVEGLSCRPCSKIGYAQCPRGHFRCMREQDEDQVILLAGEALGHSNT